ncbi:MAG: NarK/NasA family nitrate transporter [Micavibrio sp.]|nr:NarK/NasA family nitrate transporter [Micavibrio sp.]MBK9562094.1 NarK/NasA family nitrate transporter [Micavibrio sp.]
MPIKSNISVSKSDQTRTLILTTMAFTASFAVWTIFSIIGIQIKADLGLNETQFGLLVGTPILTGSLIRLILGIWTDIYGGRLVLTLLMLASALATWLLSGAETYPQFLLAGLGVGIAGGTFIAAVAYVSRWFDKKKQGLPLGIIGAGNVGAAVTKFLAPVIMVALGWVAVAKIWAVALAALAIVFWLFSKDDPVLRHQRETGEKPQPALMQLAPLKNLQVWRFSLYYFFVFGAFVALALWLPKYFVSVYGVSIITAGMLGAMYSIPGSLFRIFGGWISDKYGARRVMYWTFIGSLICLFFLSYPATDYVVHGVKGDIAFSMALGIVPFTILVFGLGFFMSLGKAAVYKHIPAYYPENVGSVGGLVGMIGGLGGFALPIAFGMMNDLIGVWTSCFMLLFILVAIALIWMHFAIRMMEQRKHPDLAKPAYLPELGDLKNHAKA